MSVTAVVAAGLEALAEIIAAIQDAREGKVTPEAALERIAGARSRAAARDAAADRALEDKFRDEGGGGG